MAYVQRVQVTKGKLVQVQVAGAEHGFPADVNWAGNGQAQSGSGVIYDKAISASESPAAFLQQADEDLANFALDIEVHDIGPEYQGKNCLLVISTKDTYVERDLQTGYCFAASQTLAVTGPNATFTWVTDGGAPYGLFGLYNFTLRVDDGTSNTDISIGVVPLEFYFLPLLDLPDYFKVGAAGSYQVPLLLLRMFVLPQRWQDDFDSAQAWIKLVVNIVFGSQMPLHGKQSQTADHWLKYNSISGGSTFTDELGKKGLNLQAWLDAYRNWSNIGVTTSINCYDQAAITEVALSLGLPHRQIHWEFHQVYGFIDAELVGWGSCNSPYFRNDLSKIRYTNPQDPNRQGFRNHAYLSWTDKPISDVMYDAYNKKQQSVTSHAEYMANALQFEQDNNLQFLMIDACAGPHIGTESRQTYEQGLTLIPDPNASFCTYIRENSSKHAWRWVTKHILGMGITKYNTSELGNLLPDSSQAQYETEVTSIKALLPPFTQLVVPEAQIPAIQDVFRQFLETLKPKWPKSSEVPIRPYTTADGTIVHEYKLYYTESTSPDAELSSAVSMRVALNSKPGAIQHALASQLALATLTSRNWLVKERSKIAAGGYNLSVIGSFYIRAFQIGNIAVEVKMNEDYAWPENSSLMQSLLAKVIEVC